MGLPQSRVAVTTHAHIWGGGKGRARETAGGEVKSATALLTPHTRSDSVSVCSEVRELLAVLGCYTCLNFAVCTTRARDVPPALCIGGVAVICV